MAIPDLRFKTGSVSLEVFWIRISLFEQKVSGPSSAVTSSQADSHACTEARLFQSGYKQAQVLPGRAGLQKDGLQMQQQMEHLGHCNIAEMHFKTLSQNIKTTILRESRD